LVDKLHAFGVIVGVVYLLVGVTMINDTAALIDRGVKTNAVVVDYHKVDRVFFYPVVEFKDEAGSTVHVQSIDNTIPKYPYANLPIIYDPVNPSKNVRVNIFETLWLGPTFLISAGAVVVILSLGLHWNKTRKLHTRHPLIEKVHGSSGDESAGSINLP
jgi:hypothetical protein